ncbi:MAG: nodulation protein NfeD [Puniceicoccaceae bacterium]|nr:MAG: nodulation protein NfeD [Puniceicoccaceae bacterium]
MPAIAVLLAGVILLAADGPEGVQEGPIPAETPLRPGDGGPAVLLEMEGPIGPATDDYFRRSMEEAADLGAVLAIIRMDTPGGLDASMRAIIRTMLDAPIPVVVYVAPEGARATSAGTFILYAAHVAAMAPGTHLGAATPVQIGGGGAMLSTENGVDRETEETGEEEPAPEPADAMQRKIISDAVAYIRGLAELRGRNADWAEKAVREGASLTSSEALERNVIEILAEDLDELLEALDGREVKVAGRTLTLATRGLEIHLIEPDWRTRLLSILTNPNVAYILMLLGIYGLILEFSNPGAIVPGVTGAICLLLALFAFQLLPVNYAGLALIILGLALMVGEVFAPSFGALGIGGGIAFILGSIMLFDGGIPGFELYLPLIIALAAVSAVVCMAVLSMAMKAWRRPVVSGNESLIGRLATALDDFEDRGRVSLQGESWMARTSGRVRKGETVRVTGVDNLTVNVEPATSSRKETSS